jgi:nucleoside phosphorylase
MTMPCDVLILGAFHPELTALNPLLGEKMRGRIGGADVVAGVVGIGLPMAAVGAAMQVAEHAPKCVVLVGTCGAYRDSLSASTSTGLESAPLSIGDVAVAARLCLTAPCVTDGLSQMPEPMSVEIEPSATPRDDLLRCGGKKVDIATTLGITVDEQASDRLARAAHVAAEHLEAYGVATACSARGVPFGVALGVANYVGPRAREEWRTHHRAAAAASVSVVVRWLNKRLV